MFLRDILKNIKKDKDDAEQGSSQGENFL